MSARRKLVPIITKGSAHLTAWRCRDPPTTTQCARMCCMSQHLVHFALGGNCNELQHDLSDTIVSRLSIASRATPG
eukprot:scaffold179579_cov30-Tisochrysis_lutea.AAC.1